MNSHDGYYPYAQGYPHGALLGQAQGTVQGQGYGQIAGAGYAAQAPAGYGYPMAPQAYNGAQPPAPFLNLGNDRFLKGLVIGAAAAYLLTNESVQRAAIKGAVKAWTLVQGGVEEMKERFQDAEAELRAAQAQESAE